MSGFRLVPGSLLARLVLGYALITLVFASAWLWSLYGPLTQAALNQQQRNLTAVAQAAALVAAQSQSTPADIAEQLVARTDLRLTIVASDGRVLADSSIDPALMENHLSRPEVATALEGRTGVARRVSRTEGREELYVAVRASLGGDRVALRVSQPLAQIEEIAARSRRIGLILLVGAFVIAATIAAYAIQQTTRPIAILSRSAERMAGGNLSAEVPEVPTDLAELARALASLRDQMRMRLDALEAEKLTLKTAVDGLTDAVILIDSGVIRLANNSSDLMFRRPAGGWRDTPLASAGLPGAVESAIEAHLADTSPIALELDPDPLGRVLRVLVAPLSQGTETGRAIVSVSDITERSRLDRMRRDFVANASHELKTPTSGIRLLAQSVEAAAGDGDIEQALAFARQIEAETERLQRLVGDLLDLSRLDTSPNPGAITDLRQAVDNALLSHRSAASRKGLALKADFSAVKGSDVFAAAEPTDLAIALDNLLDNAIAYTQSGSVSVSVEATAATVSLTVSDTGPGIAPEHRPRIFERFYRVDSSRSRDAGGTGLGLALVRHVAERSGGTVELDSAPGVGSRFMVVLPRAK